MSVSLYDLLRREVKKMVGTIGCYERGNIHPLVMNELERYVILLVLEETGYNFLRASRALGISRNRLYRRVRALGIRERE